MAAAVTALRKQPSSLSSSRAALAEKIARRDAANREEAALEAALMWDGTASQGVRAAELALEAAASAVEQAKVDAAQDVVSTALGHALAGATSIKQARQAHTEAQDMLDAATAAKAAVQDRLKALRTERSFRADFGVKDAAIAVLREECAQVITDLTAQCEQAQRTLLRAGLALNWLSGGVIERGKVPGVYGEDSILDRDVDAALHRFSSLPDAWPWMDDPSMRPDIAWANTLTRLMSDAAAPLPTVG